MNHVATPNFWRLFDSLPREIQRTARRNFKLIQTNSRHPSLHFKKIRLDLYSVRVGLQYRGLATKEEGIYVWFWFGSHEEYDKMIRS